MVFLYIVLALAALIILLLTFYLSLQISYDGLTLKVSVSAGPVKVQLAPAKKKKINIKKLSKKLKNKKLGEKKTAEAPKKQKKSKSKKSPVQKLREIISEDGEEQNGMQIVRFILDFIRRTALEFDKKMHVDIAALYVGVDMGNAHSTAVCCGILSQAAAYTVEILDSHTVLNIKCDKKIHIVPIMNGGSSVYEVDIKVKIRIGSLLRHAIHLLFGTLKIFINKKAKYKSDIRKETAK